MRGTALALVSIGLCEIACTDRGSTLDDTTGAETGTETGAEATPLPSAEGCTLELLWETSPLDQAHRPIFTGLRDGGFLLAAPEGESEGVYESLVLSRYDASGELVWTFESGVDPHHAGVEGDLLELGDGRVVFVVTESLPDSSLAGRAEMLSAAGELLWIHMSTGTLWDVVGPQDDDQFVCAGAFAPGWGDPSGMSTGRYTQEGPSIKTAWIDDTTRRLVALAGAAGRTWVVDRGCAIDELDEMGLPVPWGPCVEAASFRALVRLADGTLVAGGSSGEAPHVRGFGEDGGTVASWIGDGSAGGTVYDLAPISGGGVIAATSGALWVLDEELELVATCKIGPDGEAFDNAILAVDVDDQGRVSALFVEPESTMVVRVLGLLD